MSPTLVGTVALVVGLLALFASIRWTGWLPYGSDNDEYVLVAQSLVRNGTPEVAGFEGTKYPLAYPVILAIPVALGLPVAPLALVVNGLLLAFLVAVVVRNAGGLARPAGAAAAAVYVATNVGLWDSVFSVMPDVAFVVTVALVLDRLRRAETVRDIAVVTAILVVATALKSVGVLVAAGVALAVLVAVPTLRRWFWAPPAGALAAAVVHALLLRSYPESVTGYGTVFFLSDPYDTASPRLSLVGIGLRVFSRVGDVLGDMGKAVVGPHAPRTLAIVLAIALLAAGAAMLGRRWPIVVAIVVVLLGGLTLWPFQSIRFGLPLVPFAALGVAWLTEQARRLPWPGAGPVAAGALVAAYVVTGARELVDIAETERAQLAALHTATAEAVAWLEDNTAPDAVYASPAYREFALRADRPVLPMGYSTDPEDLLAASAERGADYLLTVTSLYPRRVALTERLVGAYPNRFEEVFSNDAVRIHQID